MSPTYVEPRDFRLGEFLSSSDLNVLFGDNVARLFRNIASRASNTGGQAIPSHSDSLLSFAHTVFDRGMHPPGMTDGLSLTDEGAWLTGMQVMYQPNSVASYIGYLRRSRASGGGDYVATFDGLSGSADPGHQTRFCLGAPLYGYDGDLVSAHTYQSAATDVALDITPYSQLLSPVLWGLQLTAGRTKETWTPPKRTASSPWSGTDVPTDTQLAQQVRDNLRFLRSRPVAILGGSFSGDLGNVTSTWKTNNILTRVVTDPYGMFDPNNTDRLIIRKAGIYLFVALWGFEYNATKSRAARLLVNGSIPVGAAFTSNAGNARGFVVGVRNCALNDYVQLQQWSGATVGSRSHPHYGYPLLAAIHISDAATPPTWVTPPMFNRLDASYTAAVLNAFGDNMAFLYGPPCVVGARTAVGTLASGTWATVGYTAADIVNNIGSALHNPASGAGNFTIQHDGVYLAFGQTDIVYSATANAYYVRVTQNDVPVVDVGPYKGITASGIDTVIPYITLIRCKAGDVIKSWAYALHGGTTGNSAGTGGTWFGLARVAA